MGLKSPFKAGPVACLPAGCWLHDSMKYNARRTRAIAQLSFVAVVIFSLACAFANSLQGVCLPSPSCPPIDSDLERLTNFLRVRGLRLSMAVYFSTGMAKYDLYPGVCSLIEMGAHTYLNGG